MTNSDWQIAHASAIGKSHLDCQLHNQDRIFVNQTVDYSIAIVCDGAGSARFSEFGASFFSKHIGKLLQNFAVQFIDKDLNQTVAKAYFLQAITTLREQLIPQFLKKFSKNVYNSENIGLADFHTTLTAILQFHSTAQPNFCQTLLLKIGDSPLFISQFSLSTKQIDYFSDLQYINEAKGEYANETHFITEDNWQDFLQIEWLDTSKADLIAVMSDGCADLTLTTQPIDVYRPFFANLLFNLCHQPSENYQTIIEQSLANPATYRLTGDDKSLVLLMKNLEQYQGVEPFLGQSLLTQETKQETKQQAIQNNKTLTPSQPQPTALPNVQALSDDAKQRRNLAVYTTVGVLLSVGLLAWFNADKLNNHFNKIAQSSQSTLAKVSEPRSKMLLTPSPTSQGFAINYPLNIVLANEHFFIQTFIILPNDVSKDFIKNSVQTQSISHITLNATVLPNILTPTQKPYSQSMNFQVTPHCQSLNAQQQVSSPLLANIPQFSEIVANQRGIYCKINFQVSENQPLPTNFSLTDSTVVLTHGLDFLPFYQDYQAQTANTNITASTSVSHDPASGIFLASTKPNSNLTPNKIQVHYLPNDVNFNRIFDKNTNNNIKK
ncbi:protein phosphatase 2C domain-containing protein [Faucicola boevrei]|uniref:protein phosphatase 2C domain-containing protein n=1 Tax=Faucicola boevrei TaxID=346665 RepID=UPI00037A2BA4|nr:protein phosphatase 2C domain-containing protein [Moraxella boevrei]